MGERGRHTPLVKLFPLPPPSYEIIMLVHHSVVVRAGCVSPIYQGQVIIVWVGGAYNKRLFA